MPKPTGWRSPRSGSGRFRVSFGPAAEERRFRARDSIVLRVGFTRGGVFAGAARDDDLGG